MYKFWLTREERKELERQKREKEIQKHKDNALRYIEYSLLHSKSDSDLWIQFNNKKGSEYEVVKKVIDQMDFERLEKVINDPWLAK